MTVVLDTNVLVSACWTPDGLEARVVRMALDGRFQIAVTPAVWDEYNEVLDRRKLAAVRERSAQMLARLDALAVRVEPGATLADAADEDDNRFLECAVAASAGFLITGNLRDYPRGWAPAHIVNARQFLGLLGNSPAQRTPSTAIDWRASFWAP